jgi:hypothetical protein
MVYYCAPRIDRNRRTGVLFAVCLIACLVGSVVSNNASALLLYPIVVDLSTTIDGLERREAVLVLMVASSASFLTPISYQTNLMVMEPGKYEFLDFLKFGIGLQLVSSTALLPNACISVRFPLSRRCDCIFCANIGDDGDDHFHRRLSELMSMLCSQFEEGGGGAAAAAVAVYPSIHIVSQSAECCLIDCQLLFKLDRRTR